MLAFSVIKNNTSTLLINFVPKVLKIYFEAYYSKNLYNFKYVALHTHID